MALEQIYCYNLLDIFHFIVTAFNNKSTLGPIDVHSTFSSDALCPKKKRFSHKLHQTILMYAFVVLNISQ